jgi:hypothetical protein
LFNSYWLATTSLTGGAPTVCRACILITTPTQLPKAIKLQGNLFRWRIRKRKNRTFLFVLEKRFSWLHGSQRPSRVSFPGFQSDDTFRRSIQKERDTFILTRNSSYEREQRLRC